MRKIKVVTGGSQGTEERWAFVQTSAISPSRILRERILVETVVPRPECNSMCSTLKRDRRVRGEAKEPAENSNFFDQRAPPRVGSTGSVAVIEVRESYSVDIPAGGYLVDRAVKRGITAGGSEAPSISCEAALRPATAN